MPYTNTSLIDAEEYLKIIEQKLDNSQYYSRITSSIAEQIDAKLQHIDSPILNIICVLTVLFFGTARDLWKFVKYEIIGIPKIDPRKPSSGKYLRNANTPVMHCPVCGAPGKPNGYTKAYIHQYICSKCGKHFTENTSLEKRIFRYILLVKAVAMFRYGLSNSSIASLLGVSRNELKRFISSVDSKTMKRRIDNNFISLIKTLVRLKKYVLVSIDTTFFGETAVILIKVNHGKVSIYLARGENIRSIKDALNFLKSIEPKFHNRLIFLQDGSPRIYSAIREYFKDSIVIRQFHNPDMRGIVHVHFVYNEKQYTLVIRWDHFVDDNDALDKYRGLLKGEAILGKNELILYEGDVIRANHMLANELQRKINFAIGFGMRMRELPELIEKDHDSYLRATRDRIVSMVAREIREFQRLKKYVVLYASEYCKEINNAVITGLRRMLQVKLERYSNLFLLKLYRSLRELALCSPNKEQHAEFIEVKRKLLEAIESQLKSVYAFRRMMSEPDEVNKKTRKTKVRRYYSLELFRGTVNDADVRKYPQIEYVLEILRMFFNGKYITTNVVEGHFGRVKSSIQLMRNVGGTLQYVFLRFTSPAMGTTNRFFEILNLLDLFTFDAYLSMSSNETQGASEDNRVIKTRVELHVGQAYSIYYKNRRGEVKHHVVLVDRKVKRRNTAKDTYYMVKYLEIVDSRKNTARVKRSGVILRGDRVESAVKLNLRIVH